MKKSDIIKEFCILSAHVQSAILKVTGICLEADCFCKDSKPSFSDFQFHPEVLNFIVDTVEKKIKEYKGE